MKIVDLSPAVPHGFMGPPSTNLGVQMNVRKKNGTGHWQSTQLDLMSLHTGTHVESAARNGSSPSGHGIGPAIETVSSTT